MWGIQNSGFRSNINLSWPRAERHDKDFAIAIVSMLEDLKMNMNEYLMEDHETTNSWIK